MENQDFQNVIPEQDQTKTLEQNDGVEKIDFNIEKTENTQKKKSALIKGLLFLIGALFFTTLGGLAVWYMGKSSKEEIKAEVSPTPIASSESKVDEMDGWEAYRDNLAGFEIKLPNNWEVFEETKTTVSYDYDQNPVFFGKVNFINEDKDRIQIVFGDGFGGASCQTSKGENAKIVDIEIGTYKVPLCNYISDKIVYFESPYADAGGPKYNKTSYNFTFSYQDSASNSKDLILQILSTFKFMDMEDEVANWKTYRNEEYGFEFKYPNNWSFEEGDISSSLLLFALDLANVDDPRGFPTRINPNPQIHELVQIRYYDGNMPTSFAYTNGSDKNETIKDIEINGYRGIEGYSSGILGQEIRTVFLNYPDKNEYISISLSLGKEELLDQILSTFKFTN